MDAEPSTAAIPNHSDSVILKEGMECKLTSTVSRWTINALTVDLEVVKAKCLCGGYCHWRNEESH
jgi:hypothetical protein